MKSNESATNTTFINGKGQIIEMLSIMDGGHREMLLRNIGLRDPSLASELREKSISIKILEQLRDSDIKAVFPHIPAQIWGLSIKDQNVEFQRRSLKLADKGYAFEAFKIMKAQGITKEQVKRAQKKVIDTLIELNRRSVIRAQ